MRSDDFRPASGEREEPPLVFGLIGSAITQSSSLLRTAVRSIDQRVLVKIWGGGAVAMLLFVLIGSIVKSPGIVGVAQGLFAGIFLALLFAVGFGWLMMWARESPKAPAGPSAAANELSSQLAPTLRELNALRADIIRQVKARSLTRVPIGIAAGIAFGVLRQRSDDPPGLFGFLMFIVLGALAGEVWAAYKLERQYCRSFKDAILPQLAAGVGTLTYRRASMDRVSRLGAERILPEYDNLEADDEIAGTHDGLEIEIIEARLKRRVQKKTRVVFDGLLVGITLPRSLTGTTVVMTDKGMWENFKTRWRGGPLEPVRLEHPEFEGRYEVYSTDQIEARALLTPAFMDRFMKLAASSGFSVPGAMAEGNLLTVALPKRFGARDLFEPPPYWMPAGGEALVRMQSDIRAVLAMANTVIRLDFWATGRQLSNSQ